MKSCFNLMCNCKYITILFQLEVHHYIHVVTTTFLLYTTGTYDFVPSDSDAPFPIFQGYIEHLEADPVFTQYKY